MSKVKFVTFTLLVLILALCFIEPAMAGPGGKIARVVSESWWGKIAVFVLVVVCFPWIVYVLVKERQAVRRAHADLLYMEKYNRVFEWLKVKQRALDCFHRIHAAWRKEDTAEAAEYMTDWYWQNQQMAYLERWEREGLVNICDVKKVTEIKPLLFVHRNEEGEHEESLLVLSIEATMKDYLQERKSGKVVEGNKKFRTIETIWSFTMIDGKWRVSDIEEDYLSLEYAKMRSQLPRIEDTVLSRLEA